MSSAMSGKVLSMHAPRYGEGVIVLDILTSKWDCGQIKVEVIAFDVRDIAKVCVEGNTAKVVCIGGQESFIRFPSEDRAGRFAQIVEQEKAKIKKPEEKSPCPFCGSNGLETVPGFMATWIRCIACGATSPKAWSEEEAIKKWNGRNK